MIRTHLPQKTVQIILLPCKPLNTPACYLYGDGIRRAALKKYAHPKHPHVAHGKDK